MAEPTIEMQVNDNTEGAPNWVAIDTAVRWTGPSGVGDAFAAPIGDDDEAWFDAGASPNDGEFWHDTTTDAQCAEAGRQDKQNMLQVEETGTADPTADPPEFTAYDDAGEAATRTAPSVWMLVGTAGTGSLSIMRGVETTGGVPGGTWTGMEHDVDLNQLQGNTEKVVCAAILAASGVKQFAVACCAPHDSTPGLSAFVYCLQYTYE